jgi:large-conductance mechanosensitive channel
MPIPAVIGIVIGSAAFLLILAFIIFLCVRRHRRMKKRKMGDELEDEHGQMRYMGYAKPEPIAFNPHAY